MPEPTPNAPRGQGEKQPQAPTQTPEEARQEEQKAEVRKKYGNDNLENNVDDLLKKTEEELNSMLKGKSAIDRPDSDWPIVQALFEKRGASRPEAKDQILLTQKYKLNTVVAPDGTLGMWPASATPEIVTTVLNENPNLEPRIKGYLSEYLQSEK